MLSGTTGTQLAARLKKLKPTVPILLRSGMQPDTMRNVDAFMSKGEAPQDLVAMAWDLVRRFSS
jgi:hypothetical protein